MDTPRDMKAFYIAQLFELIVSEVRKDMHNPNIDAVLALALAGDTAARELADELETPPPGFEEEPNTPSPVPLVSGNVVRFSPKKHGPRSSAL